MVEDTEAAHADASGLSSEPALGGLLPALYRLDCLLERAINAAESAYGPDAATDPFRGLYVGRDQVQRSLAREPATPLLQGMPTSHNNTSATPRASATTMPAVV